MSDVKIPVGFRRKPCQHSLPVFLLMLFDCLFGVVWRFHLPSDQRRYVLNLEGLFLLGFVLLFSNFLLLLLLFYHNLIGQTFGFPGSFEQIFQQFTLNRRHLFSNSRQKLKLLWLFISPIDIFIDIIHDLFIGPLNPHLAFLFDLLQLSSALHLLDLDILQSAIQVTLMGYISIADPRGQMFPESFATVG